MLLETDIYRAIRNTLEAEFPKIKVQIKDIKNPKPPCFYIKFINSKSEQSAQEFETVTISFDIIYFSKEETLLDLLTIQGKLKQLFQSPLKVSKEKSMKIHFIEIDDVSISINEDDYILNCTLDIELIQRLEKDYHDRYLFPQDYNGIPQDSGEVMEEMHLNINNK